MRSSQWFDGDDEVSLDARVALTMAGQERTPRTPIIALVNSAGGFNPCNQPLSDLIDPLRRGVESVGGVAVELNVMSLGEDIMKPAAMLYRNLVSMEVEESVRSQPVDGIIILAACDKSVPAGLMGAFSTNLPTLLVMSGPRPSTQFGGRRIGTGTDLWRMWDARRAGTVNDVEWRDFEEALASGRGTCNTMGTASTMGIVCETLGLAWPASTTLVAGHEEHARTAHLVGRRIVEMVRAQMRPSEITREAWLNAARVVSAIGGSTNAVIHLTAMARRLGVTLTLKDFDEAGRRVPVLVDVEPTGAGLVEDFHHDGATPTLWRALGDLITGDTVTATGDTINDVVATAAAPDGVIRSLEDPIDAHGALRVVRGNLAPDGALIKRSAASAALLRHRGPAIVLRSSSEADDFAHREDEVDENSVIVLSGAGPIGGPGMPEWAMVSLPASVLRRGITDMVRVSDARMSGTSFGTVFLHVAPEAAVGGPIALVRDGDMIEVDADAGRLHLDVSDEELSRRSEAWRPPPVASRGYLALYSQHVAQASDGCDFDFLAGRPGVVPTLDEPVVGRS